MSDSLKIQVIVDGSQVTAGMSNVTSAVDAATAKIKASFGSLADAPAGIQTALLVLQTASRQTAAAVAEATAAINQLGGASSGASGEVKGLGDSGQETAAKMTGMERAMALASGRMLGMAAGAGMLGGSLGRVGAASSAIGPLLSAAFPVIAIAAFVDILGLAYDKIIEITNGWAGWDKEAQQMYDLLIGLNQQTIAFNANLAIEKLRLNEIGLKDTALGLQKEKDLKSELTIRTDELAASLARENSIRTKLAGSPHDVDVINPETGITETVLDVTTPAKDEATRLNKELEEAIKNSQKLSEDIRKLKEVSIPAGQKDTQKDRNADAERAAEFNDKLIADTKKLADEDLKALAVKKELEKQADQELNKNDSTSQDLSDMRILADAQEKFDQDRLTDVKNSAVAQIDVEQDRVKELARLGKLTTNQALQQLNDLEAQKLALETAYLQKRMADVEARFVDDDAQAYVRDRAEFSRLLTDKQKAEDAYQKNRQKNINAAATAEQATWNKMAEGITRIMDQAVQGIVMGTQRFSTAFAHMIDGMLAKFIEAMLQMVEQWILTHVLMLTIKKSTQQQEVLSDAKAAAAAAWKAVAGIPIIGPVLAPIAAATAFAGVEAFSAEGGMVVPADNTLSLLHANEMVLPANLSSGIKDLIGNGAGGQGVSIHYAPQVRAMDARGVEDVLSKNATALTKIIKRELRRTNQI